MQMSTEMQEATSGGEGMAGQEASLPAVLVCAADERYAMPLGVMLESVFAHASPACRIDVYIIDCGLRELTRAQIDSQTRSNLHLHWRPSVRSPELGEPLWGHVSGATYERLIIERYLPERIRRALWLDCDLLILDDVTALFRVPLQGRTLLAVRDPFIARVSSRFGVRDWRKFGLAPHDPYFNAGVMLVDLERWRRTAVATRATDYLREHGRKVYFNEQEALNAVIGKDWAPLDDRWNVSANPFHARRQHPGGGSPAIVHFAGRVKPWQVPDLGEMQECYFNQLDRTPWRGIRPQPTVRNRLLSWYVKSRLRHLTYWLENQHLWLSHLWGS